MADKNDAKGGSPSFAADSQTVSHLHKALNNTAVPKSEILQKSMTTAHLSGALKPASTPSTPSAPSGQSPASGNNGTKK